MSAGLFNKALELLSLGMIHPIDWLGNPRTAMPAIVIMSAWQGAGFQMLIFLAGLQGISSELYDAAKIDGATAWQRFRHVTLPGLRQTIFFVLIVTTIAALGLFTQIDVMTQGGPGYATTTAVYQIYSNGFTQLRMGYASAQAFVLAVAILIVSVVNMRFNRDSSLG